MCVNLQQRTRGDHDGLCERAAVAWPRLHVDAAAAAGRPHAHATTAADDGATDFVFVLAVLEQQSEEGSAGPDQERQREGGHHPDRGDATCRQKGGSEHQHHRNRQIRPYTITSA